MSSYLQRSAEACASLKVGSPIVRMLSRSSPPHPAAASGGASQDVGAAPRERWAAPSRRRAAADDIVPAYMSSDRPPDRPLQTESKTSQRAIVLGVVLVFAFGLIVPWFVLSSNADNKASVADGVHLTADQQTGRELFASKCVVCHTLSAVNSVGRTGPNLDVLIGGIPSMAARKELVLHTILEGPAIGNGNMPALLYQGKEAEDVASFVAAVAGR
jgi:mono/diheme cytochrome c family protein